MPGDTQPRTHYKIGPTEWMLWHSPPPPFVQEQVEHYVRPGTDSVGIQTIGLWAPPFECLVEAHFPSYAEALVAAKRVYDLDRQVVRVMYELVDYHETFGHDYSLDHVETLECRAVPRLIGPNYDYPGGGRLVMRLMLTPIKI